PRQIIDGPPNAPLMTKTKLGWLVHGPMSQYKQKVVKEQTNLVNDSDPAGDLRKLMEHYFSIESLGIKLSPFRPSQEDERALGILNRTTKRIGKHFQTGLLWKVDGLELPESKMAAERRLRSIEKRMDRDPKFAKEYCLKMEHFLQQGYARATTSDELATGGNRLWFLPHFAVVSPRKPDKMRLVFDCAAKSHGVSLNDALITGPDYLTSLPKNLFNFRSRPIALTGDIKEMYPQIKIIPEDQFSQCFLWRGMEREMNPKLFLMTSMMFGTKSSPSSALFVKNQNAQDFSEQYPEAAEAIINNHYMDNYLDSFQTVEEAMKRYEEVFKIHSYGGFHMCGWSTNSKELLSQIPQELTTVDKKQWTIEADIPTERILGMVWNPNTDQFTYDLNFYKVRPGILDQSEVPTKRDVSKVVMAIYDPLGIVSHLTVAGNILLQDVWKQKTDWDDEIDENVTYLILVLSTASSFTCLVTQVQSHLQR
ncbi:unnamed protein product, partial [Allacma fusca]